MGCLERRFTDDGLFAMVWPGRFLGRQVPREQIVR